MSDSAGTDVCQFCGEQVDATPLPAEMLAWMQPFVDANYRPEAKRKVRRNELYERDASGGGSAPRKRAG